ncbi:membrane protein [Klebsiella variicola]|uniref:Membrane protein n=1 Tax=Klebsiella variicola TaxID=244366 RepID=A0A7H4MM76_KLEVA|nr:membrane protein [Klebsiella variicola]
MPLVGDKLYSAWHGLLDMGGSAIMAKVRPYIGTTTSWFVGQAAHIGKLLVYCGLMLLFSALLYWRGEQVAYGFRYFATRLAAKRGDAAVLLAGQAVRAVALGVVVTALTQAVLGGIGLAISGVPYAALLTVVMIFTCLVQLGPLLVLVPSIIWLYWSGGHHLGHRAAGVELRGWHHGQRHSSGAYPYGRRPADDPHPYRRHWRTDRLRHDRSVYRSSAAGRLLASV